MNRRRNNPGFTLIEVLVALVMVTMIVSMVYGSYAATSRSLEVYDSRLGCSQRTQLVLRLMARQIRCAYAPVEPNNTEAASPQTGTQPAPVENATRAGASQTWIEKAGAVFRGDPHDKRSEILEFLTTAALGGGSAAPQRLSYTRYRYDPADETLWIDCAGGDKDDARQWQLLLDGIKSLDFAFHDGKQWQPKWDYAHARGLPRAVRIDLTVVAENGREHHLETTASIGCRVAGQQTSKKKTVSKKP
jgi:prepilin-type N-terminal cleavage/methylation domain-containing protein